LRICVSRDTCEEEDTCTRALTFENIVALTYLALLGGVEAEHEYMLGHLLATAARSLLSVY
jgi:hypothetical protein